jgi:hypothetical protein
VRTADGNTSMAIDARNVDSADTPAAMGDVSSWGGLQTSCVGGHLLYGPFTAAATAGDPVKVTLDGSIDWRDRLCWIRARLNNTGGDIRPGTDLSTQVLNQRQDNGAVVQHRMDTEFYTANGHDGLAGTPRGGANLFNYTEFLTVSTDTIISVVRIYADKDNGRLILWNNQNQVIFGSIWIMASEQTGKIIAVP